MTLDLPAMRGFDMRQLRDYEHRKRIAGMGALQPGL
jgi:hypothetical protein